MSSTSWRMVCLRDVLDFRAKNVMSLAERTIFVASVSLEVIFLFLLLLFANCDGLRAAVGPSSPHAKRGSSMLL